MTAVAEPPRRVDLARAPDFRLGVLSVRPSVCRAGVGGREQRVEPKVMEVLVTLVRAAGRTVSRDELVEACWGGRFISDDAIGRVIAKVRGLARGVEPPPFELETVPKVGFRLIVLDGKSPDDPDPPAPWGRAGRRSRRAIVGASLGAALMLVLAAVWAIRHAVDGDAGSAQNGRVEVLLFEPLRQDPELQRFSVALGDAVVRGLTSNGIDTVQRPVRRDAGGSPGGAELRVVGTVDHDADKRIVNAQIIDRRSGAVLWSGRVDRPAEATASFHEEAATRIADTLQCGFGHRAASRKPVSATVFGLMLNACHLLRGFDPPRYLEVTRQLAKAAPDLSVAHSMHAVAMASMATGSSVSPEQAQTLREEAETAARRALALDPRNGEAYFALGISRAMTGRWREEEQHYLRAAALSPELTVVRNWRVGMLRQVGRIREATELNQLTAGADPFSWYNLRSLAMLVAAAGDYPEAAQLNERLALAYPEQARDARFQIAVWWEPPDRARPKLRALAAPFHSETDLACLEKHLQRLARASAAGAGGLPEECADLQPDWRIRMHARQGDVDAAYAELEKALPRGNELFYLYYPEMTAVRADPRFMPLAKRLGLVDYWLETDRWPDFCADPSLPYDCRAAARAVAGSKM